MWVVWSLIAATGYAGYDLLQKYAYDKHLPNVFRFGAWGGLLHVAVAAAILLAQPLSPGQWTSGPVLLTLMAGVTQTAFILLVSWVIQHEKELSRVVPAADTYPVFVTVLAVLLLGERLGPVKWLAIALVMGGALVASWQQNSAGARVKVNRSLFLLLVAAFLMGVFSVIAKHVLGPVTVWQFYALTRVAAAPGFLLAATVFGGGIQPRTMLRRPLLPALVAAAHGMLFISAVAAFVAFEQGPVSLASAVMATRPLLVLAYTTALTVVVPRILSERTSPGALASKGAAAGLVTAGIAAMALV